MGKVVKLEPTDKAKVAAKKAGAPARGPRRRTSTDRSIGDAGPGATRRRSCSAAAASPAASMRSARCARSTCWPSTARVNQFDVYVGTSAGAFIAALCANGVTPEEMMRVVTRQGKPPFKDIDLGDLLRPNLVEFARKGALLPLRVASLARQVVAQRGGVSMMDVLLGFAEGLPSGAYTGAGIETYLHEVLERARAHGRLQRAGLRAVSDGHRPRQLRARRVRRRTAVRTCRSRPPCARRARCRWSTRRCGSATAS